DLGLTGTANQGRSRRYIRLRTENSRWQWHPGGMRILLGRRLGLPIRKYESETESGLLVLWNRAGSARERREHRLSGLRLLRRERRTCERDHSDSAGIDEACREKIRAGGVRWRWTWIHARRREARCQ